MKKIRVKLQALYGGDFLIKALTNAVEIETCPVGQKGRVFCLGQRISERDAKELCADRNLEVSAEAMRD